MQFDEYNEALMVPLAQSLAILAQLVFPPALHTPQNTYTRHCAASLTVTQSQLSEFIHVINSAMGQMYVSHKGRMWPEEKLQELLEPGLVFVWYAHAAHIASFVAFKIVEEDNGKALYLYEIQVVPACQHALWGRKLMAAFHLLALVANSKSTSALPQCEHLVTERTSLTVFADNDRAFEWYSRMGYALAPGSPENRILRSGNVVKPDYYLLTRPHT